MNIEKEGMDTMGKFDWQQQLEQRRRRTRYERIGVLFLLIFVLGFGLWRFFMLILRNTP